MAVRQKEHFDLVQLENLQERCFNLHTAKDRAKFMLIVMDYMDYLRSEPWNREGWVEGDQLQAAQHFVHAINNDRGWPQARQAAPEFQNPPKDFSTLRDPLQYIMTSVQPRLFPPPLEVTDAQKAEEGLVWRAIETQIGWIRYLRGIEREADEEARKDVQNALGVIKDAREAIARNREGHQSATTVAGGANVGESSTNTAADASGPSNSILQHTTRTDQRQRRRATGERRGRGRGRN